MSGFAGMTIHALRLADEFQRVILRDYGESCVCILWEDGTICAASNVYLFKSEIKAEFTSAEFKQTHEFGKGGSYIGEFWLITMSEADRAMFQMRIEY